ncbi:4-hydroxy-tetrahydrodipicolinate reductase [Salinibacillus kushneri]|uniref:4-hydroxy-tetrahydrodipicolinate reductase n=1 Tax=Salinibacillus kushneri TaxID=237682 RepID=A0A1I0I4B3_9BACI|nr:4-hydroxy-tetrahydrodipicolinate reductase [Salinibacillus kushneri]SET90648.1 4-hydroxy-tetrahydrodipicolinate reductase [Salinibacillus kushneri]
MVNIIVAGPRGKMGSEALRLIERTENYELVGCIDRKHDGMNINDLENLPNLDARIYAEPQQAFQELKADVLIDLTSPEVGYLHTRLALENGVRPVVGTSGFTSEQLDEIQQLTEQKELGAVIAPNFAVGAVLMMQFAKWAAKYFPDVEIIEKHHDQKLDAPSGTAVKTAQLIEEVRSSKIQGHPEEKETLPGARGANEDGMRIHSVRLPGLIAHQEVIFGGTGQGLTIKHDSYHRQSFMSGVKLAVDEVQNINMFVYGLENLLE